MSVYFDMQVSKDPGRVLYKYWLSVLKGALPDLKASRGIQFGSEPHYGIGIAELDEKGRPILGYGPCHWGFNGQFWLAPTGEFKLNTLHGWKQRDRIARHTFLTWYYYRSTYNWLFDASVHEGSYSNGRLNRYRVKELYVPQALLSHGSYGSEIRPWLKLDANRAITYSRPHRPKFRHTITPEHFEKFEALRLKRYALLEKEDLRRQGLLPPPRQRREIDEDERAEREEKAAQAITAHLNVSMAARSVPLRKTPEEEGLWQPSGSH